MNYLFGTFKRIGTHPKEYTQTLRHGRNTQRTQICVNRNKILLMPIVAGILGACAPIQWGGDDSGDGGFWSAQHYHKLPVIWGSSAVESKFQEPVLSADSKAHVNHGNAHSNSATSEILDVDNAATRLALQDTNVNAAEATSNDSAVPSIEPERLVSSDASIAQTPETIIEQESSITEVLGNLVTSIVDGASNLYESFDGGDEEELVDSPETLAQIEEDDTQIENTDDAVTSNSNELTIAQVNALTEMNPSAAGISSAAVIVSSAGDEENLIAGSSDSEVKALAQTNRESRPDSFVKMKKPRSKTTSAFNLNWQLAKAGQSETSCQLSTPTIQVESPGYSTQVWFDITDQQLLVNSTTNLNPYLPRVGMQLDDGPLLSLNRSTLRTNVIWEGDIDAIIRQNSALRVYLGGDELGSRIQEAFISLDGLKRAYPKYQNCLKYQLSAASL